MARGSATGLHGSASEYNTWPKRLPCFQSLLLCELEERLKWGRSPIASDLKVLLQAALPHHKIALQWNANQPTLATNKLIWHTNFYMALETSSGETMLQGTLMH
ncbi:hypothetical protein MUK42_32594 [Musa troglodytarum]|uniref:Uncharacterized protein n=1 Tax=Musa troglodytarum TaxID=320322 RepID=A0A9E7GYY0_9LILI|nr:hypothetical protein MUK42_32594 [Musa troglodytarum]